jgi:hypothetical protein
MLILKSIFIITIELRCWLLAADPHKTIVAAHGSAIRIAYKRGVVNSSSRIQFSNEISDILAILCIPGLVKA